MELSGRVSWAYSLTTKPWAHYAGRENFKEAYRKISCFFFFKFGQNPDETLLQPAVQKGS